MRLTATHRSSLSLILILVAATFSLVAAPPAVFATPANKKGLAREFGDFLPAALNQCATCHLPSEIESPESLDEFPHNPFGDRLRRLADEREKQNQSTFLADRLRAVADEDADKDGVPNRLEILLGHNPGDAADKPDPGKVTNEAPELTARFEAFLDRYPWKPFQRVQRPSLPERASAWSAHPVDRFIAAEHFARKLTPRPEAPKELLLRRLTLDLTGLNPTPADLDAFLADASPDAYEKVVDRLLASPEYGRRWGRHWMDIWRYADWGGYKDAVRFSQPHIWRWRDWIIESLNEDKGYDDMLIQMLAADELAPENTNALRATGYLVRHFYRDRNQWLDNVIEHTSKAFLGLTMNCAKCHDHMYDPLSMDDYYAMRAVFAPYDVRTEPVPGELDPAKDGLVRAYDKSLEAKVYLFERGDERYPVTDRPIAPAVPKVLGGKFKPAPVSLPITARQPHRRDYARATLLAEAKANLADAESDCARLEKDAKADPLALETAQLREKAAAMRLAYLEAIFPLEQMEETGVKKEDASWKKRALTAAKSRRQSEFLDAQYKATRARRDIAAAEAALKSSGDDASKKSAASKKQATAKKALADANKELEAAKTAMASAEPGEPERDIPTFPESSTGRRLAFAKWLTDKNNPLTARVATNHIWLRHFGTGLVPTPDEFGGNGRPPTHPALLDWLAAELMDNDWSMKHLHRLIVTSHTYRMASTTDEAPTTIDPDNHYLWRAPTRRLEGELVRDNLLHIAGLLDPAFGGADIPHTKAEDTRRRSLYLQHAREKTVEFIQIFDGPGLAECYQRDRSVAPHQALALTNSKLTFDAAAALAEQLSAECGPENHAAFTRAAFRHILSRPPSQEETDTCIDFVATQPNEARARRNLLVTLFNHNDFITIR